MLLKNSIFQQRRKLKSLLAGVVAARFGCVSMRVRLYKEIASGIEQNSFRSEYCVSVIFEFSKK